MSAGLISRAAISRGAPAPVAGAVQTASSTAVWAVTVQTAPPGA